MQSKQCVVAADAARANWYVVDTVRRVLLGHGHRLRKVRGVRRPRRRERFSDKLTEQSGLRSAFRGGPNHNVDDRRDSRQRDLDEEFAQQVVESTRQLVDEIGADHVVIAASPSMLGAMREAGLYGNSVNITEVAKDLSTLPAHKLCDYLFDRKLLDAT